MSHTPVRVGVLSLHKSKETKAILNAVESLGHRPEWLREENTVVDFDGGEAALEPDVDVIANRLLLTNTEQPAEALGIAHTLDRLRPMLNRPTATATAAHKLATAASLTAADLPFPRTVLALSGEQLNRLRESFGDEVVYKTAIGTHGGGVWRVGRGDLLAPMVGNRRALLQALVATDGDPRDLRVYVVGDRVVGAMYRYAAEGDWRTNVPRGGSVQDATDDLDGAIGDPVGRARLRGRGPHRNRRRLAGPRGQLDRGVQGALRGHRPEPGALHRGAGDRGGQRARRRRSRPRAVGHARRLHAVVHAVS